MGNRFSQRNQINAKRKRRLSSEIESSILSVRISILELSSFHWRPKLLWSCYWLHRSFRLAKTNAIDAIRPKEKQWQWPWLSLNANRSKIGSRSCFSSPNWRLIACWRNRDSKRIFACHASRERASSALWPLCCQLLSSRAMIIIASIFVEPSTKFALVHLVGSKCLQPVSVFRLHCVDEIIECSRIHSRHHSISINYSIIKCCKRKYGNIEFV